MKKSALRDLARWSAAYVVAHGRRQINRGRQPSMAFGAIRNPRLAFLAAVKVRDCELGGVGRDYNVVFRYTRLAGGYCGVVTWTSFLCKEEFDAWYTPDIRAREAVIAQGVTPGRAVELVRATDPVCYFTASIEAARHPVTREISPTILAHKLETALFVLASDM